MTPPGQLTPVTDDNVLVGRVAQLSAQPRQQAVAVHQHKGHAERGNHNERADDAGGDGTALWLAVRLVGLGQDGGGGGQDKSTWGARAVRLLLKLGEALAQTWQ